MMRPHVVLGLILGLTVLTVVAQVPPGAGGDAPPGPQSGLTPDQAVVLAQERWKAGQAAEAMELLRNLLQAIPGHTEANLLAGDILIANNDYDTARNHFKQVLSAEPSNFRANLGYGKILVANRSPRHAVTFLEQAESVAPAGGRSEVKQLLATVYFQMGQMQKAIDKAQEAVQADPDDLMALRTLIELRQPASERDPRQTELAAADAEKLVQKAAAVVEKDPWTPATLQKLGEAYQVRMAVLQAYHNSFYERDRRGQSLDRLLPGRGPEAAAVLMRAVETRRQSALLALILAEHESLMMAERAVADAYDPKNVGYLEKLLASYQQIQELTARLAGPGVFADTTLQDKAVEVCHKILEVDANNAKAREYLQAAGLTPTGEPHGTAG